MRSKISLCILLLLFLCAGAVFAQQNELDLTGAVEGFSSLNSDQKSLVMSAMPIGDPSNFSIAKILAYLIFGGIGFVAFSFGKKEKSPKPLVIGIVLMVYPYFINNTFWLYAVGAAFCLALYIWRE